MKLLYLLLSILAMLGALKLLVVFMEPRLTFFPSREVRATPSEYGISFREFSIPTEDGQTLAAWFLPNNEDIAELLFFHGNAGNISAGRLDLVVELHRRGFSVFIFDYRGYGESTGRPTEKGIYLDSQAATKFFWEHVHQPGKRVVFFGRSLGGVTAAFSTTIQEPDGLILECTFGDKQTLLRHFPVLMRFLGALSRYELSTARFLERYKKPVLLVHGDRDSIVPVAVGEALFRQLETPKKELYVVAGAGHADLYVVGGERYWARLTGFVEAL